jgi:tripartite-type tricarboxylate transporter receptor subunit TctC
MLRLLFLLLLFSLNANAQQWPLKPIKLIVPHAPGGNSDTFGRILAAKLSERMGQQVIVENRAGAGGTVASEYTARSAPDGYTLLVGDNGTHAVAPTLFANLPYKVPADFTSITLGASFPTVLLVHPSVPAQTITEFVALAKAQPGKLTYSSAGTGNGSHLAVDMFLRAAGDLQGCTCPTGRRARSAGGACGRQATSVSVNTSCRIKSGRLRARRSPRQALAGDSGRADAGRGRRAGCGSRRRLAIFGASVPGPSPPGCSGKSPRR